jgi:endonuclease/exonuclease/phosphatase (EEP) superfamily protein YafD
VSGARKAVIGLALIYPVLLLGLCGAQALAPQRADGPALAEIAAPYLFLPLLPLGLLALGRGAGTLRFALLLCGLVYWVRFPVRLGPPPSAPAGAPRLSVMNWNVRLGGSADELRAVLGAADRPDIVAIEEGYLRRVANDPALTALYPYQIAYSADSSPRVFLLSVYPPLEKGAAADPAGGIPYNFWTRFDLGGGRSVVVVAGHPTSAHPALSRGCAWFACFDTDLRDGQIAELRALADPFLAAGEPLILLGDLNVTEREPIYATLAAGLRDAHREAGTGVGATWRPARGMAAPLALLRIDYLFSSPNVTPLAVTTDCTPRGSDHCLVRGVFALP